MKLDSDLAKVLKEKYNPEGSLLRRSQMRMFEMLVFIDKICKDNNLSYWITTGTLLGAFRHQGFIPWDDDADICMPYKDALKLKELLINNNMSSEFVLQCRETDEGYFGPWLILRDLKSEYIQNSKLHNKRKYRGLQVDIFVMEDKVSFPFLYVSRQLQRLIDKPLLVFDSLIFSKLFVMPLYFFTYKIVVPLFRLLNPKKDYLTMPYGTMWYYKLHKKYIYPLKTHVFEGYELSVPNNSDAYLSVIYGDWREVPENIHTHQADIIIFDKRNEIIDNSM